MAGSAWSASAVERKIRQSTRKNNGPRRESYLEAVAGNRVTSTGTRKRSSLRKRPAPPTTTQRRLATLKAREDLRQDRADGLTVRESRAYRNVERATGATPGRARTMDEMRAESSYQTQVWAAQNPAGARELRGARRDLSTIPNAQVNLSSYATRATLKRREAGAGGAIGGLGRVVGNTVGGIASAVYHDPIDQLEKAGGTLIDVAKASPSLLALAGGLAITPTIDMAESAGVLDSSIDDRTVEAAKAMASGAKEHVVDYYGPSWRGEKGAAKQLRKQIREDGALVAVLDLGTLAMPANIGLGVAARSGALGAAARTVATRQTAIRYGADAAVTKNQRRTAGGIAVREAHNAARRGVQNRRVRRSDEQEARTGEGNLPLHRAIARQTDEAVPISDRRAARRQRFLTADEDFKKTVRTRQRLRRFVGGATGLMQAQRLVTPEERPLVAIGRQLGIRKAEDVARIVPDRIAEIEARRAEAIDGRGEYAAVDADAARTDAIAMTTELERLRALQERPEFFDQPEVQASLAAQDRIFDEAVGGREGLGAERKAEGRAGLQGETVGVERAATINRRAMDEHNAARVEARETYQAARAGHEEVRAAMSKELAKARRDVDAARARADVPGRGKAQRQRTLERRRAQLDEVKARADRELEVSQAAVRRAAEDRKAVIRDKPRMISETRAQYAARVDAEFEARGLARPGYAASHYEAPETHYEKRGITQSRASNANPMRHTRSGTNYRLGNQGHDPDVEKDLLRTNIERGARLEAEQNLLQKAGIYFNSEAEAKVFLRGIGAKGAKPGDKGAKNDTVLIETPFVRKDTKGLIMDLPDGGKRVDHGDYVSAHGGVFAAPRAVYDELQALGKTPSTPARWARRAAHAPQTALLALSPSWFIFQRVNDLVGMAFGGSILQARQLQKMRKELRRDHPDSADMVELMSGGNASSAMLNPYSGQQLGRLQRIVDENPTLSAAWHSDTPASDLLRISPKWDKVISPRAAATGGFLLKKAPTALLRADAKITGAAREAQYLQNLQRVAKKMDPDVKKVNAATGPMGHALKTGDIDLIKELLEDPKWQKARDEAAESLNRVMGDWHTFTAAERNVKDFAAFYGFLRYSTRMVFYTLPVDHPLLALTVAQLGNMSAEYTKSIIGDELPYGLGALYGPGGTIISDLTRANPLTGPLLSLDKPEKLLNIGSPLIGILASAIAGHNIGLSDSTQGYLKALTTNGDPSDTSLTMTDRLQYLADRTMGLLSPYKMAEGMDPRAQSDDSTLWNKQLLTAPESPATQAKLNRKNEQAGKGGWNSVLADAFPIFFSDERNWKDIGERVETAALQRAAEAKLDAAKRRQAQGDPLAEIEVMKAEQELQMEELNAPLKEAQQEIDMLLLDAGIKPRR